MLYLPGIFMLIFSYLAVIMHFQTQKLTLKFCFCEMEKESNFYHLINSHDSTFGFLSCATNLLSL